MIVVRDLGRWTLTDPREQEPREVRLEDLRLEPNVTPLPASVVPLPVDLQVSPVVPVALWVVDGALATIDDSGSIPVRLSHADALLLDLLTGPHSALDLALRADLPLEDIARGLRRLELAGLATAVGDGSGDVARPMTPLREVRRPKFHRSDAAMAPLQGDKVHVVSAWPVGVGPPLGLGVLLAAARVHDEGALLGAYEFHPPRTHDELRSLVLDHKGPVLLLCSDYTWSTAANIALARELSAANPQLVVVHGGPDAPANEDEVPGFLAAGAGDVAIRGEAEEALIEVLERLAGQWPQVDLTRLADVAGLSYVDPRSGAVVRTPDRERPKDLGRFPSAYLSGVLDDVPEGFWSVQTGIIPVETNRGCPYGCTYCDWGSATRSRIRSFPLERVIAEMEWFADRNLDMWFICDANFGMLPRDVGIAEAIADIKRRTGVPTLLSFAPAKNTVRHLSRIFEIFSRAGIATVATLAFQTRDETTLSVIDRSNIRTDQYDELVSEFRRLGLPMAADVIVGLPGSTVDALREDLQYCIDEEVQPRLWVLQVLPNAPMNAPSYRERYAIRTDSQGVVRACHSFEEDDHARMMRLRASQRAFEHMGLLRHILRYLQWDHGILGSEVLLRIADVTHEDPARYPLLRWVMRYLEIFLIPPVSFDAFYQEVARFMEEQFGVGQSPAFSAVLRLQRALMPDRGRTFPDTVLLEHDYLAYYRAATAHLVSGGNAPEAVTPLSSFGPGTFEVWGDPAALGSAFRRLTEERGSDLFPGEYWQIAHFELDSPLTRIMAETRATPGYRFQRSPQPSVPEQLVELDGSASVPSRPVAAAEAPTIEERAMALRTRAPRR